MLKSRIRKQIEWCMGHRIPNHNSKCRNVHGHNFMGEFIFEGDLIEEEGHSSEGMVIDFSDVKTIIKTFIDEKLDHGFMFYEKDSLMSQFFLYGDNGELSSKFMAVNFIPTAENISKYLFEVFDHMFKEKYGDALKLVSVRIWETNSSMAEYTDI